MLVEIPKAIIQQSEDVPEGIPVAGITPEENSSLSIIPRLGINPVMHSLERFTFRRSTESNLRGSERFRHRRGGRPRCSKCNGKHTSVGECRRGEILGLKSSIYTPFKIAA